MISSRNSTASEGEIFSSDDLPLIDDDEIPETVPDQMKNKNLNYLLTNARSLSPKMGSLIDYFDEYDLASVSYTHLTLPTIYSV